MQTMFKTRVRLSAAPPNFLLGYLIQLAKKSLINPKLTPIKYSISSNGSTVYSNDKNAARVKAFTK